jgi:serine/threonine protein kinase
VVRGLKVIHRAGLVHRDIKPSNILLDGDSGKAVVGDLGIVRRLDSTTAGTTTTGAGLGTYRYMAPEQWQRPDQVDGRADQYALGMTFYEVLTGILPVGSWRPASEINPSVPRQFDRVLERLLQAMPQKRYPTMEALQKDLRQWLAREEPEPLQPPAARSSRPVVKAVLMLGVGVVLGFLFAVVLGFYFGLFPDDREVSGSHRSWPSAKTTPTAPGQASNQEAASTPPAANPPPNGGQSVVDTASASLTLQGHTDAVLCASYSPDGRMIVTASADNTAIVWDAQSGQRLQVLKDHTDWVRSARFSPDGQYIVTVSDDRTAIIWNARSGQRLIKLQGHRNWVRSASYSPDGRRIVTAWEDETSIVWDFQSVQQVFRL